ncbi:hypothetical protein [Streptomyces atroolivaceus]|uniref:hypothetical protein n=1 Tax=Streptomyces atroolivaceus TaxID=66869 RepID=UPI0036AD659A
MIQESGPWRAELLDIAKRLEKRKVQRRWTDRTAFLIERDVMIGAYAVRRLKESFKVSDELARRTWPVEIHEPRGRVPDVQNSHKFWELYDLEKSRKAGLSLANVCNQVIHSWIWGFAAREDELGLGGVFISSDRKRKKCLYFLATDTLVDLFRSIGEEEIYHVEMRRDAAGEMHFTRIVGRGFGQEIAEEFELSDDLKRAMDANDLQRRGSSG